MPKTWETIGVNLHTEIKDGIKSLNFPTMTPIQAATIPQLINQKDVVAEAVTGSGKTLAFLIPLLQILKRRESEEKWKKHKIGALVISPTRELAMQTREVLEQLLKFVTGLTQLLFVGGTTVEEDLNKFRIDGGNILICTPGRLEDLLTRKSEMNLTANLKNLEILILDEADRLLDLGFQKSLDTILSYLPRQRRTGLFSATQTKEVEDLIRAGLRNPVLVSVSAKMLQNSPELLNNYYIVTKNDGKLATLLEFLSVKSAQKALLFLPTCACVDYWAQILPAMFKSDQKLHNLEILAIHGKMKEKRKKVLDRFKNLNRALLICTDVLARGIDLPEVDWVLQFDPPASASAFVHRVGRTARQGRPGSSLILLLENETAYVHFIEKNQRVKLTPIEDLATQETIDGFREKVREIQKRDRDVMERGTRAFVSHIRAYSKHECNLLLKLKELPMGALAATYGLLQLPKMPELKNRDLSDFPAVDFDFNSVPYRDRQREEARQMKLDVFKVTGAWPSKKVKIVKKPTVPWSIAKEKKSDRKEKRLKRKRAKELKGEEGRNKRQKKGISEEDFAELAKDVALIKKLKKKKISEKQFEQEFGLD